MKLFTRWRQSVAERRLKKQIDELRAELSAKDQAIFTLHEQLEKERSTNRIAQVEIEQLSAVVARDRMRVQAETLSIPELSDAHHATEKS